MNPSRTGTLREQTMRWKGMLLAAGAALLWLAAPDVAAGKSCAQRISELERNVSRYERRYGPNSRHAILERHKLRSTIASCSWYGHGNRWSYNDRHDRGRRGWRDRDCDDRRRSRFRW
jgi:hypothetical protein